MISVIFLNYNRRVDLQKSLEKIFLQQDVCFEVIVVDQNSVDGSQEMIKEHFPSVRLYELDQNLGVAGGRNFGAKVAKGEYLVFVDDDAEFLDTNSLRKIGLVFENNSFINIVAFNINGHPEKPEKYLLFSPKSDRFTNCYIGCGHAIRKSVFELLGGYTKSLFFWGEEIEFAIKSFSIVGNKILYKGDVVLYHRVSQIQRLKWKDGRFYYKVRNRLALMKNLLPFPISYLSVSFYIVVYFIRGVQHGDIKSLVKGIGDSFLLPIESCHKLNLRQCIQYFKG